MCSRIDGSFKHDLTMNSNVNTTDHTAQCYKNLSTEITITIAIRSGEKEIRSF